MQRENKQVSLEGVWFPHEGQKPRFISNSQHGDISVILFHIKENLQDFVLCLSCDVRFEIVWTDRVLDCYVKVYCVNQLRPAVENHATGGINRVNSAH